MMLISDMCVCVCVCVARNRGDLVALQRTSQLLLFGRLRPDKHVQRVETAAANALFSALDQHLKVKRAAYMHWQAQHETDVM